MSKFLMTHDYNQLQAQGIPDDLIKIILSAKYPDYFDVKEIENEINDENEIIRTMMLEKGFKPFHETYNNDLVISHPNINGNQEQERKEQEQEETENS
jgi:hypothetical protein